MRIVDLEQFRTLPAGTWFQKATEPFVFEGWHIKGDTLEVSDFIAAGLDSPVNDGSESLFARLDEMWADGSVSYPMALDYTRDGCFEREARFLVLEYADLLLMGRLLNDALALTTTPGPTYAVRENPQWTKEELAKIGTASPLSISKLSRPKD